PGVRHPHGSRQRAAGPFPGATGTRETPSWPAPRRCPAAPPPDCQTGGAYATADPRPTPSPSPAAPRASPDTAYRPRTPPDRPTASLPGATPDAARSYGAE